MPTVSLRVLAAVVAALAVSLGLLRHPTPVASLGMSAALSIAIIAAACLAVGAIQPNRSFWIGFLIASLGVLWINYGDALKTLGLFPMSRDLATWMDFHLEWSRAPDNAERSGLFIANSSQPTVPNERAFNSIVTQLSAFLAGLLGGWAAWAARRPAMRTPSDRPPAG